MQRAEIQGTTKAYTEGGSDARVTAGIWKSPVCTLRGGWGGAAWRSGQALARRTLLWSCWSETHGLWGPSQLWSSMAKPDPSSTLPRTGGKPVPCRTTRMQWKRLHRGKVSGVGLFQFCSHSRHCCWARWTHVVLSVFFCLFYHKTLKQFLNLCLLVSLILSEHPKAEQLVMAKDLC